MMDMGLSQAHGLYNDVIDLILYALFGQQPIVFSQFPQDELVRSFTAYIVGFSVFILYEIARLLINCVVSQVHAQIF